MLRLDLPPLTPAEQLAADEVILDECEAGHSDETLVFWEPRETFVVVGYANKVATEVNVGACEHGGIPIFRRCSGGGTIVQMRGGLNYGLVLRIGENLPTRNISAANHFIMEKNRAAVASIFRGSQLPAADRQISVRGHTDLCLGEKKIAGNSQRRRKNFLLFHGTVLLNCDLQRIGDLLLMPSLAPAYRDRRPHEEFVTNLNLHAEKVKTALAGVWNAIEPLQSPPLEAIKNLAREKYATLEWNRKF